MDDFKEQMQELYRRARKLMASGIIDKTTHDLALQIMRMMIHGRCRELVTTWQELASTCTASADGEVMGAPAPGMHYFFLGALQQAEESLGLVSHVDRVGLDTHLADGRVAGMFTHFTKLADVPSDVIGPQTRLLFVYEAWVSDGADDAVAQVYQELPRLALPKWITGRVSR